MTPCADFPDTIFLSANTHRPRSNQGRPAPSLSKHKSRFRGTAPSLSLLILATVLCSCQTSTNLGKAQSHPSIDRASLPPKPTLNPPSIMALPVAPDGLITVSATPTPKTLGSSAPHVEISPKLAVQPITPPKQPSSVTANEASTSHFVIAGYPSGQYAIPGTAKPAFDLWTKQRSGGASYAVAGFTDPSGTAAQNKKIALSRANEVRSMLLKKGVKAEQVQVFFCTDCPAQPLKPRTPAANGEDRRVVVSAIESSPKKPADDSAAM